jgi:hypothetical protein
MSEKLRTVSATIAVALLFALPLLPEILGTRVLVFRDAQITHWPWRRVAMASLDIGRVPFVNERASGGQPLLANPNAVLLYPTVLLERLLPSVSAFNLHYLLHVLWALLGARLLARRLGLSPGAALFSGCAYAFSGMMLSYASAFANSGAAAAWLPWCAAAALEIARAPGLRAAARPAAATGLAFGLQLLAGEPAISLLTAGFTAFLCLGQALAAPRRERAARAGSIVLGGAVAAAVGAGLAAALLLPLRAVLPLTYRGQHLYSRAAFGAAPFLPYRVLEWFFPRFGGDPSTPGSGASWLQTFHPRDLVYVWCASFGVIALFAVLLGGLRREFWTRRTAALAAAGLASWLFSFGLALPFSRLLFASDFLRRLRYPIKFYLLTTLCVALLAGFAADLFRTRRPGRREAAAIAGLVAIYAAAFLLAGPGAPFDRLLAPFAENRSGLDPAEVLAALRSSVRGDALLGALAAVILLLLRFSRGLVRPGYALALLSVCFAMPWGLPLFVSASGRDLLRPPALLPSLGGPGRLYVSPDLPAPDYATLQRGARGLPRFDRVARALSEQMLSATGQPFGVSYAFDRDPDGSYGWYNRLAAEACSAAAPAERARLLRAFGTRWALAGEREAFPGFRPVTGVAVAGRQLLLHAVDEPIGELRWASRAHRRKSLSGALDFLRSDGFRPETDVVLPGAADQDAAVGTPAAPMRALTVAAVSPDGAAGTVDTPSAGHVVFARTWFPSWRAWVDGAPVRVLVANARDLAVAIPPGRHTFEFSWDRSPFHRGVRWQAAALLVAAAVALWTRRRS